MKDKQRELRAYRNLAKREIDKARANNLPCYICRQPIDYEGHPSGKLAPTFDHFQRLADGGDILGPGAIAHRSCNSRRGNTKADPIKSGWSRNWL